MPLFDSALIFSDDEASDGPENMARDEALFYAVKGPWVRFYEWMEPTVSLGYFSSLERAKEVAKGRALVRRWTGGGIVEHGDDFTWSVGVPEPWASERKASQWYEALHAGLAEAYRLVGVDAALWPCREDSGGEVCFRSPVAHDVRGPDGGKWAGGAQRRTRAGLLYQGSARLPDSRMRRELQSRLTSVLGGSVDRQRTPDMKAPRPRYADEAWLERAR